MLPLFLQVYRLPSPPATIPNFHPSRSFKTLKLCPKINASIIQLNGIYTPIPDLGLGIGTLDRGAAFGLRVSIPEGGVPVWDCCELVASPQHCKSRTTSSAKLAANTARSGSAARPARGLLLISQRHTHSL